MEYRTKEPDNLPVLQRFGRWLALKQYQIEVTFGVYMFTPTEKFIFCRLSRSLVPNSPSASHVSQRAFAASREMVAI